MHGSFRSTLLAAFLAIVAVAGYSPAVQAQYVPPRPVPQFIYPAAPDMNGPGFYLYNSNGVPYGPSPYVRPAHMPFQGMVGPLDAGQKCFNGMGGGGAGIPFHRFVRSPRDFFMQDGTTGAPCR